MKTWRKLTAKLILFLSVSCFAISLAHAALMPKLNDQAPHPNTVIFGVYPTALYDFDAKQNTYKIDFYAWWRSTDPNYHPENHIEIINAEKYKFKMGTRGKNGNEFFTNGHYYASIRQYWDPKNFPFEHETLLVGIEDFDDINHVLFEPDYEQSDIHPEFEIPNWKILNFQLHKSVTHYNSNFGDISTPKGLYSRITLQIDIKHDGWVAYFNYYIAFFITAFLSILIFFMEKESIEVQMLIIVSAIFSFIGNKYVLDSIIADTAAYSLANLIQILTFTALFCGIVCLISEKSLPKKQMKRRVLISHIIGYLLGLIYILSVSIATYFAAIS